VETELIRYNLHERGRKYRGTARQFDVGAIAHAINSDACQERVKHRDMQGYYGHWPRLKFGLNPQEGGLEGGKPALVEPALITTHLKADRDGTIEHKAQFLDTASGQVAAKLYHHRTGGFSSAIDASIPEFFGFDYVLEPNYATNRGWTLDSIQQMSADDIQAALVDEQLHGALTLVNTLMQRQGWLQQTWDQAQDTIAHLGAQNQELTARIARLESGPVLDSAAQRPLIQNDAALQWLHSRQRAFAQVKTLPMVLPPADDSTPAKDTFYEHWFQRRQSRG